MSRPMPAERMEPGRTYAVLSARFPYRVTVQSMTTTDRTVRVGGLFTFDAEAPRAAAHVLARSQLVTEV